MDSILGALLVIGAVGIVALSIKRRDPWPALLLIAALLMLLPSALSIAFPRENPSVVRTGGALPMLMIICAAVPGLVLELVRARRVRFRAASVLLIGFLIGIVLALNANRVFAQYPEQYCPRAQNAYDIAQAMEEFVDEGNSYAQAWIVGYPHWVDSRAVGIWIGDIYFPNTVMGPEAVSQVDLGGEPGWFVLNVDDEPSLQVLRQQYPQGTITMYESSQCPEATAKQFVVFETQPQQ
jgi:disulfide bond formation protein DsbB